MKMEKILKYRIFKQISIYFFFNNDKCVCFIFSSDINFRKRSFVQKGEFLL